MTTIKEILDRLADKDRRLLNYAFEHGLEQHVKLEGGKYVGVNIKNYQNLKPELEAGLWSFGTVTETKGVEK